MCVLGVKWKMGSGLSAPSIQHTHTVTSSSCAKVPPILQARTSLFYLLQRMQLESSPGKKDGINQWNGMGWEICLSHLAFTQHSSSESSPVPFPPLHPFPEGLGWPILENPNFLANWIPHAANSCDFWRLCDVIQVCFQISPLPDRDWAFSVVSN